MNSSELFERSKKVSPGGVHSPVRSFKSVGSTPIFFKQAQGAYLTSVEDKTYIDMCMSFGPLILGHRDPEVQDAVMSMIDKVWTLGTCEPYSLELAEFICGQFPFVEKIRFVNSGTEAVMSALRVARAATNRSLVLKFDGCYHGHLDSLLVKAGSGLAGSSSSDSAGVPQGITNQTLIAPLNDVESLRKIFSERGNDIAVVALEPLPANYGLLPQTMEFLKEIESLCKKHGALLLFDEVISGFRVAWGGMAELANIKPDLLCYGKIMGGGFPVGAYAGRRDLMGLVAPEGPVYQAGTLSANPVGMTAGLSTLKKVKRDNVIQKINQNALNLKKQIDEFTFKNSLPLKMVVRGSLFWFHQAEKNEPASLKDLPADHGKKFIPLFNACLKQGIYLAPSGYEVGFLSYAHTDSVLDQLQHKMCLAIKESFLA